MKYTLLIGICFSIPVWCMDLPGIPAPGVQLQGTGHLIWGNDAFGPGGGAKSDDFRTSELMLAGELGPVFFGIDHSLLTTTNPHGAPIYWGYPDPTFAQKEGASRVDELVLSVGLRKVYAVDALSGWLQGGAGVLISRNLGGEFLQSQTHSLLSESPIELPYDESSCVTGLGHAGIGGRWWVVGPLALVAGTLGQATIIGGQRWQSEVDAALIGPGGGTWIGLRGDGHHGNSASRTAAVVAAHEDGVSLVAGYGIRTANWGLSLETLRNLSDDGQMGRFVLQWDEPLALPAQSAAQRWYGRVGLLPAERQVPGRGVDYACGLPIGPLWALVGWRDQELATPYTGDMAGHRNLVWLGVGGQYTLFRTGPIAWNLWSEGGLGWRHSQVDVHGFITLDEQDSVTHDAGIARAAIGVMPMWDLTPGTRMGLLGLFEGTLASSSKSVDIAIHDPDDFSVVREEQSMPIEGSSFGVVFATVGSWVW